MSDFRRMSTLEKQQLWDAMRGNADNSAQLGMSRDTSFVDCGEDDNAAVGVIDRIASVPNHY